MVFNSYEFLIFFPIVVSIYFICPKKIRYIWLLVASYYFYMSWNPKYAMLIGASTIITYFSGILIEKYPDRIKYKKCVVAVSFISNLSILVFFKYFDFLLRNINAVLNVINMDNISKPFDVLLPVGISFYTFQALGYTVDVYRKDISAEHNILKYALFVSFFPQLVAGPIERSKNLLRQINDVPLKGILDYKRITNGLIIMLWGMFQKMVIADRIAILVNQVFDSYYMYGSVILCLGAVGFAVQIFCDFSSYSTIAIGAAQVMGFTLMENFDAPYFSKSIKEFWRRWHISLSTWFRDYLYIPLGGSRCTKLRKNINLMVTFLVSGLWHGASYNFVAWGGIHGIYQIIGEGTKPLRNTVYGKLKVNTECFSWKLGQGIITFVFVDFAWIFFRCDSLSQTAGYIRRLFSRPDFWVFFDGSFYTLGLSRQEWNVLLFSLLVLVLVELAQYITNKRVDILLSGQNIWFRWGIIFVLLFCIYAFGIYGPNVTAETFIYFQF